MTSSTARFATVAADSLADSGGPSGPYAKLSATADRVMTDSYRSRLRATEPERVAAVVARAATTSRPRTRYVVTPAAKALVHTRRLLGGRAFDAYLRAQYRTS